MGLSKIIAPHCNYKLNSPSHIFTYPRVENIMCINTVNFSEVSYNLPLFKLAPHIKVKSQSCIQRCLQNLVHQNLVQQANLYSINNRQELTYQKNALRHRSFPPVVFLTKIMETTLFFSFVYHFVTLSAYFKHDSIFNTYNNHWFHKQFHESNVSYVMIPPMIFPATGIIPRDSGESCLIPVPIFQVW